MIKKFMSLEPEKRDRIINTALEEFAQKGYKNGSTNEIVKKADISKGLLFHYFGNKKSLFLFLYEYSWDILSKDFFSKINTDETDIIKRMRQIAQLKIELVQIHPDLSAFLITATLDDSAEIKTELENKYKNNFQDSMKKIYGGIDTSGFREGLDLQRVMEIIAWIAQGFNNREVELLKRDPNYRANYDINAVMAKLDGYAELFRSVIYK